jgi:hypothetical protein
MGAAKHIPKNWRKQETRGPNGGLRKTQPLDLEVTRSEDLPQLMTTKEAATFLRRHHKTVEEYRRDGSLRFTPVKGRWYTTPGWLAEFLERESARQ